MFYPFGAFAASQPTRSYGSGTGIDRSVLSQLAWLGLEMLVELKHNSKSREASFHTARVLIVALKGPFHYCPAVVPPYSIYLPNPPSKSQLPT